MGLHSNIKLKLICMDCGHPTLNIYCVRVQCPAETMADEVLVFAQMFEVLKVAVFGKKMCNKTL